MHLTWLTNIPSAPLGPGGGGGGILGFSIDPENGRKSNAKGSDMTSSAS